MGSSPSKQTEEKGFPGSALLESAGGLCGIVSDVNDDEMDDTKDTSKGFAASLIDEADRVCISGSPPPNDDSLDDVDMEDDVRDRTTTNNPNPTSALFARALVSEVTDNPNTMTPAAMAERERRLLKAQEAARKTSSKPKSNTADAAPKPVGAMGKPNLLGSISHALIGDDPPTQDPTPTTTKHHQSSVVPPNTLQENRAQVGKSVPTPLQSTGGKHSVTIGLSLSRRHSTLGHPDTVTRQTAFDFNELQDRSYKYVSSTDSSGWMAGGGERGGTKPNGTEADGVPHGGPNISPMVSPKANHKVAAPDTVHIPIIQIDAESPAAVDAIVSALARGEVFIPHMAILPEALSVNGISPPDLVVRFGCERNDDAPPDEWPNWCLEFMHNQLYEYFAPLGAKWSKRPFQITLARKVRWKTVKHMNRYFAHAERVIDAWREKGAQTLDPQLSYIDGGATPEEVARPHGIYLLRNGVPTNYFAPNFEPPYTTKMTRSLLLNVLDKSYDKNRREWTSEPVTRLVTPAMLVASLCGCTDPSQGGFMANEVTTAVEHPAKPSERNTSIDVAATSPDADETVVTELSSSVMNGTTRDPPAAVAALDPLEELARDLEDDLELEEEKSPEKKEPSPTKSVNTNTSGSIDISIEKGKNSWSSKGQQRAPTPEQIRFSTRSPIRGNSPTPEQQFSKGLRSPIRGSSPTPEQRNRFHSKSPVRGRSSPSDFGLSVATTELHANGGAEVLSKLSLGEPSPAAADEMNGHGQQEKKVKSPLSDDGLTPRTRARKKKSYKDDRKKAIKNVVAEEEKKESGPTTKYAMETKEPTKNPTSPVIEKSDSGVSLEYSIDSSMLGDSSMLTGQYFNSNGSGKKKKADDASSSALSITSAESVLDVPTDEELFSVGWAKALDPKSGSYYYFTLDRAKIVWDNPLAPKPDPSVTSSDFPVPEGGAVI